MKAIDTEVESVLNGWFGEELDNQENGLHHKKHLYEPLSEIVLRLKYEIESLNRTG